jgi:hypothetical protein
MDKNHYLIALSEDERTDFGRVAFAEQPEPQKVFSAVWELESEVNNGGFDQYFRNCDTGVIAYAPVALRTIGASSCARIVERAIEVIAPLASTRQDRSTALDALEDDGLGLLNTLDSEFFAYPDNLTELLFEFVYDHPESFGPVVPSLTSPDVPLHKAGDQLRKSGVSASRSVATLSIARRRQYADALRQYRVLIDDVEAAKIRPGQTIDIDLAPGRHRVVAVIDWARSNPFEFDAQTGRQYRIEVGSNVAGWRLLFAVAYVTVWRDRYLYLKDA